MGIGKLNTSPDRGVLATDDGRPFIIAARELDLDLKPLLIRVPLLENVDDVPVKAPLSSVVPVKWIGVGREPEPACNTGFG